MKLIALLVTAVMVLAAQSAASASNYPCSKSKGGAERCEGAKFVCRDGSISGSKQKCTPQKVAKFRMQWEADNGQRSDEQEEPRQ